MIILLLALLTLSTAKNYQKVNSYFEYIEMFKQQVPLQNIHDITAIAQYDQMCGPRKCPFYYFSYQQKSIPSDQQMTILLVAGMHGNQYLGPLTLLYGYKYFKAPHIIYLPIANPSGYHRNTRNTYPSNKDPNRDFPVDKNTDCYTTNAALVLDHLFRTFKFDLTLILHQGANEIGFNWGTETHIINSHTDDYDIQMGIAQLLQKVGGSNQQLNMKQFKTGTMNQVIYPAKGSLDDWAYAAGKFPQIITKCNRYNYRQYPQNMANGLVFLIQMGPHGTKLLGNQQAVFTQIGQKHQKDGYVSRGIRMVNAAMDLVNPSLSISWGEQTADIFVRGCPSAELQSLQIYAFPEDSSQPNSKIYKSEGLIVLEGNVGPDNPPKTSIKYDQAISNISNYNFQVKGQLSCSKQWLSKGTTAFSKIRTYRLDYVTDTNQKMDFTKAESSGIVEWLQQWINQYTWQEITIFTIIVIFILAIMSAIFAVLQCLLRPPEPKRRQKFQQEQTSEQLDQDDLHTARGGIIEQNM